MLEAALRQHQLLAIERQAAQSWFSGYVADHRRRHAAGRHGLLILFAIMLTQTKDAPSRLVFQTQAVPAAIAAVVVAVLIALAISATDWGELTERIPLRTDRMSIVLFEQFVFPFEIVSVLLLAAVIGGVFLAKREPGGPS